MIEFTARVFLLFLRLLVLRKSAHPTILHGKIRSSRDFGILRRELLDHIIPLDERHLHRLIQEYIDGYYHSVRTHSSLDHKPPIIESSVQKQLLPDTELQAEPILGGLYYSYQAKTA